MTANHIAKGDSYLEKAINAQHGGFPSRLLDVSYNSLVALFFATTPFYNKIITESDGEDGYVYVFSLDEMFCPVGDGIKDNYTALIYYFSHAVSSRSLKKEQTKKNHVPL